MCFAYTCQCYAPIADIVIRAGVGPVRRVERSESAWCCHLCRWPLKIIPNIDKSEMYSTNMSRAQLRVALAIGIASGMVENTRKRQSVAGRQKCSYTIPIIKFLHLW
jgi:hypothetical protein